MSKDTQVQDILSQIEQLDHQTRIDLMEQLVKLLKDQKVEKEKKRKTNLTDLNRLGADIWQGVNIDQYVERERQWD